MAGLHVEVDPAELGMDADGLARVDAALARLVDAGHLPGYHLVITRRGRVVHTSLTGRRDVERNLPVTATTLWRIYSMTKPITAVAAMMLYEEGAFQLTDPIARYLPAFADSRVYTGGSDVKAMTVPTPEPIRIWHLLTHTSGLTYGFHRMHPVDAMLRANGYEWGSPPGVDLATAVDYWASLPLLFTPGTEWNYSLASDVLGRLIEVVSGQSLEAFFADRITGPLGMGDTGFRVAGGDVDRLATLYVATPDGGMRANRELGDVCLDPPLLAGGGGLVSTASDYQRFARFLARGGELDGVRLLSPKTVAYMTRNHLPGNADMQTFGRPVFSEIPQDGVGFGFGMAVVVDATATRMVCSTGEYNWGGAASTTFWVDPVEQLEVVFMTQLLPSSTYPIRPLLRQTIYGAVTG
ncbi:MAG: serine hydrolase domain-containing protein [Kineosporiaceae bacterium]